MFVAFGILGTIALIAFRTCAKGPSIEEMLLTMARRPGRKTLYISRNPATRSGKNINPTMEKAPSNILSS